MTLSQSDLDKVNQLFSYLNIDSSLVNVELQDDTVEVSVDIPEADAGIFIGRFASTLDSIQLVLSLFLRSDEIHHIHLDIGGYRIRREQVLKDIADRVASDVLESGLPRALPPLSAAERRAVHLMYQDNEELITYSEGQGHSRRLFMAPKPQID